MPITNVQELQKATKEFFIISMQDAIFQSTKFPASENEKSVEEFIEFLEANYSEGSIYIIITDLLVTTWTKFRNDYFVCVND